MKTFTDEKERRLSAWKENLNREIEKIQDVESFEYLARKAGVLVQKEQHARGNTTYHAVYTDPDNEDPGG
ncbi:MAG: hypothetical protein K6A05_06740 [Lachnospiraceae bacterium]|nr:hypothetical protein [Lachnospiraceae bacterium]